MQMHEWCEKHFSLCWCKGRVCYEKVRSSWRVTLCRMKRWVVDNILLFPVVLVITSLKCFLHFSFALKAFRVITKRTLLDTSHSSLHTHVYVNIYCCHCKALHFPRFPCHFVITLCIIFNNFYSHFITISALN